MDFGSVTSDKASPTKLVFATTNAQKAILRARSATLEARFRTMPLSVLPAALKDLRRIHRNLYKQLCPKMPEAIGMYRGTPNTPLEYAQREVRVPGAAGKIRKIDPCAAPEDVLDGMTLLHRRIALLVSNPAKRQGLATLASLTYDFLAIHPFLDGNGHTWRATLIGIARLNELNINADWTVHNRPHGVEFSGALQNFPNSPDPLKIVLERYFGAT